MLSSSAVFCFGQHCTLVKMIQSVNIFQFLSHYLVLVVRFFIDLPLFSGMKLSLQEKSKNWNMPKWNYKLVWLKRKILLRQENVIYMISLSIDNWIPQLVECYCMYLRHRNSKLAKFHKAKTCWTENWWPSGIMSNFLGKFFLCFGGQKEVWKFF